MSKLLCCQLNSYKCFNSDCRKDLGCTVHFKGLAKFEGQIVYYGCIECHRMVDEILLSMTKD